MLISLFLAIFLTRPCQSNKTLGLYSQSPGQQRKPPGLTLSPRWQDTVFGHSDPSQSLGRMVEHLDWSLDTWAAWADAGDWLNLSRPWENYAPY